MAISTVSVGLDGSAASHDALAWAAGAAASVSARLRAINVWTTPVVNTYRGSGDSTQALIDNARSLIRSAIAETNVPMAVDSVILHGAPGPSLTAEARDDDLLVLGRSGRSLDPPSKFGEVFVGSAVRYCVDHVSVPVAVIPAGSTWTTAPRVVVGIDGSAPSYAALRWAAEALPPDAIIHVVHAMIHPSDHGETPIDYELLDPVVQAAQTELERQVNEALVGSTRQVRSHVIVGSALDILLDPGFDFDMIVLGEHGETAAPDAGIGSVADHTMRNAGVPLIVIPSD